LNPLVCFIDRFQFILIVIKIIINLSFVGHFKKNEIRGPALLTLSLHYYYYQYYDYYYRYISNTVQFFYVTVQYKHNTKKRLSFGSLHMISLIQGRKSRTEASTVCTSVITPFS
jgi:hypothetical protein